jgi:hypothetical protein
VWAWYLVDGIDLLLGLDGKERNEVLAHLVQRQVADLSELVDFVQLDSDGPGESITHGDK